MNKTLIYILIALTFVQCSKDEDEEIVPTNFYEAAIGKWVSQITEETRMAIEISANDSSVYTSVGNACFTQSFSNEGSTEIIRNTTSVLEAITSNIPVAAVFSGEDLVVLRDAGIDYIDARSTYNISGSIINFTFEYFAGNERILLISGTFVKESFDKC